MLDLRREIVIVTPLMGESGFDLVVCDWLVAHGVAY